MTGDPTNQNPAGVTGRRRRGKGRAMSEERRHPPTGGFGNLTGNLKISPFSIRTCDDGHPAHRVATLPSGLATLDFPKRPQTGDRQGVTRAPVGREAVTIFLN